ncbi:MAG TPA: menaquinone biosynthesis protein [Bacteroidia bacterium]|nr:menaquinone biosynthesis protein [Bacteroidia bacterium]
MIRISAVSYLNTKPFLFGLKLLRLPDAQVSIDIPTVCARKLQEGEADLGLVPVALIPQLKEAHVLPGYCIGADGPVESVKLYSKVPVQQVKTILCDYQSLTSVMLARLLAAEHWKITPVWMEGKMNYETQIDGETAGIVIGDRTFRLNGTFPYEYDLSEEWKKMTGLPFVFACWVSTKPLPPQFIRDFSGAIELGIAHTNEVITMEKEHYPEIDVEKYLTRSIKYRLDQQSEKGLHLFLKKIENQTR